MEFGGSQLDLKKIMNVIKLKSVLPIFLFLSLLGCLDCAELRVKQGENATLECYGPKDAISVMLRWNQTNLQSNEYVFYFSDDQIQEDKQHPHFKGRVNLKDPEMKNGDFSVNLTYVVMNDSGRYECYVGYNGKKPELINSTYMKVEEPGQTGGHRGGGGEEPGGKEDERQKRGSLRLIVLSVPAVLLVAAVGFVIYRNYKNNQKNKKNYKVAVSLKDNTVVMSS